ncbi:unnamed protein product [Darwinula stevensoni]|uniref:Uncharacterized protein n=1 Tax=Darwinula stevensoni TaxID=69355 RepID=A0A7R8X8M0_9CRUS|nr:unnamed protein product [Darwinula stevensoni]CAG0888102.1 unnamed protein product [Darwinula stevensoni]
MREATTPDREEGPGVSGSIGIVEEPPSPMPRPLPPFPPVPMPRSSTAPRLPASDSQTPSPEPQPVVFLAEDEQPPEVPVRRPPRRERDSAFEPHRVSAYPSMPSGMSVDQFRFISVLGRGHFGKTSPNQEDINSNEKVLCNV